MDPLRTPTSEVVEPAQNGERDQLGSDAEVSGDLVAPPAFKAGV